MTDTASQGQKAPFWIPFLLFALGLFLAAGLVSLFLLHQKETRSGVLAENELTAMKKQLESSPKDEALKDRIRLADLKMRQEYFSNRERFRMAGPLFLGAFALWVALAAWYFARGGTQTPWTGDPAKEMGRLAKELADYQNQLAQMKTEIARREGELCQVHNQVVQKANTSRIQALSVVLILSSVCGLIVAMIWLGTILRPTLNPAEARKNADEAAAQAATQGPEAITGSPTAPVNTGANAGSNTLAPSGGKTPVSASVTPQTTSGTTVAGGAPAPGGAALPLVLPADIWPNLRGVNGLGYAPAGDWPTAFNVAENKGIAWKTAVSAPGKSSPVVAGGKVFLTGGDKDKRRVLCFDAAKGALLWDKAVDTNVPGLDKTEIFEETGFCACTPATDGKRVCAIFATGELAAFDLDGKQLWSVHLGVPESLYSYASSLLMADGALVVQFDQGTEPGKSELIGINPENGKEIFRTARPTPASWASPVLIQTPQGKQIITLAPEWAVAYEPAKGTELWRLKFPHADIAASPAFADGLLYLVNDGAALMAVKPGGKGELTEASVAWKSTEGLPDTSSPACDGKHYMQVTASGRLTSLDAKTGKLQWETVFDGNAPASIILAGEKAYLACESGVVRIWKPGDTFQELGRGDLGEKTFATPAFVGGRIFFRTDKTLVCVGK